MNPRRTKVSLPFSNMAFKLLLLWSFVLLGRPQNLLLFLKPFRLALVLCIITTIVFFLGVHKRKLSAVLSIPETKRYLFFFAIMVLGIPFAYHRSDALDFVVLIYLSNILFFLLIVYEVNSIERLKSFILIISLSTAMYSFFGYIFGSSHGERFNIYGTTFDSNDTAYVLLSLFPLSLFYVFSNEGLFRKLLGVLVIFSSFLIILKVESRGGILGLGAVLAIMLLTKIGGIKKSQKAMILIIICGGLVFNIDKINMDRYLTLTDISSDYNLTSETGRLEIWKYGVEIIIDHPIIGVGVNSFPRVVGYKREQLNLPPRWQVAHNSYIQVAAELGLVGFFVFFLMNVKTMLTFLRISRIEPKSPRDYEIRIIAGMMLLGFVGHSIAAFFLTQGYSIYFTLFFALGAVIQRLKFDRFFEDSCGANLPKVSFGLHGRSAVNRHF